MGVKDAVVMVASKEEAEGIYNIILNWVPPGYAMAMVEEVWEKVGKESNNNSLKETILMLQKQMEDEWQSQKSAPLKES